MYILYIGSEYETEDAVIKLAAIDLELELVDLYQLIIDY